MSGFCRCGIDTAGGTILGVVQEDVTDMYGNLIFKEDENQVSEIDRIKKLIKYPKR